MAVTQPSHAPGWRGEQSVAEDQGKDVEVVWPENGGQPSLSGMNQ